MRLLREGSFDYGVAVMSASWYVLSGDQQLGPYTGEQLVQYVAEGRVVRETMVWAEGLPEWVSAAQVEGLFPAAPVAQAAVRPPWIPGGGAGLAAARPAATAAGFGMVPAAEPGGPYPYFPVKPASFGLWIGGLIGMAVGMLLALVILSSLKNARPDAPPPTGTMILAFVMLGLAGLSALVASVYQLIVLYRGWACLQPGRPRTTPGMAVGLLLVPIFNFYWIFVAWHGLAKDWNRVMGCHDELRVAPRLGEGLFLAMCICSLLAGPLGMVLLIPAMLQLCRGINFMAFRRNPQSSGMVFR
jgi:hypothetical protein